MNKYYANVNGSPCTVKHVSHNLYKIDNIDKSFSIEKVSNAISIVTINGKHVECVIIEENEDEVVLLLEGNYYKVNVQTELEKMTNELLSEKNNSGLNSIAAPMPGLLAKLLVKVGDEIKIGDPLYELEAMKMKNVVKADINGTIKEIKKTAGNSVEKGAVLIIIES